jgi:tetratricopeptide (TPR) repeat protein
MYFKEVKIQNLRSFQAATLRFNYPGTPQEDDPKTLVIDESVPENVNLILGTNGSGKSTVLMALAISLIAKLPPNSGFNAHQLIRKGAVDGQAMIQAIMQLDQNDLASAKLERQSGVSIISQGESEALVSQKEDQAILNVEEDQEILNVKEDVIFFRSRLNTGGDRVLSDLLNSLIYLTTLYIARKRYGEALKNSREAERECGKAVSKSAFSDYLATIFGQRGFLYEKMQDKESAYQINAKAIMAFTALEKKGGSRFPEDFVKVLANQSRLEVDRGSFEKGLEMLKRAEKTARMLKEKTPTVHSVEIHANMLILLSNRQRTVGQYKEASLSIEEALLVYQADDYQNSDEAITVNRAGGFGNQGLVLSALGERSAALAASSEAIRLLRQLTDKNENYWDDLVTHLLNHSTHLSDLGDYGAAITASREALALCRKLEQQAAPNVALYRAALIGNRSGVLTRLGAFEAALIAAEETLQLWQEGEVPIHEREVGLATHLHSYSVLLSQHGQHQAAFQQATQALERCQVAEKRNPKGLERLLAECFCQISVCQLNLDQPMDALNSAREAERRLRKLHKRYRKDFSLAFAAPLSVALHQLGVCHLSRSFSFSFNRSFGLGQINASAVDLKAAQRNLEEAKTWLQTLTTAYPKRFARDLAETLRQLQRCEQALGEQVPASDQTTTSEAMAAVELLLQAQQPELEVAITLAKQPEEQTNPELEAVAEEPANPWVALERDSAAFLLIGYGATRRSRDDRVTLGEDAKPRNPRYARVASLFEDHLTLSPLGAWFPAKVKSPHLEPVQRLLNQLLPDGLTFTGAQHDSGAYLFSEQGQALPVSALSDGYRAYLGWIIDLLGVLVEVCPAERSLTDLSGVVMVDEIDSHVHPTWQRTIIGRIARTFPKLQFIFTTHSPHVVQYALRARVISLEKAEGQVTAREVEVGQGGYQGWTIEEILRDVMGLEEARPQGYQEVHERFNRAIQERDVNEAELCFKALIDMIHPNSEFYTIYRLQLRKIGGNPREIHLFDAEEDDDEDDEE